MNIHMMILEGEVERGHEVPIQTLNILLGKYWNLIIIFY